LDSRFEQDAQLMLTNPRDAFTGQSRSPNMVQFDMLGMLSYRGAIITLFLRYSTSKMSRSRNPGQRSLKVN